MENIQGSDRNYPRTPTTLGPQNHGKMKVFNPKMKVVGSHGC